MSTKIPLYSIECLIRKFSDLRISDSAIKELQEIFDKELTTLSKKSAQIVEYNGRKTIKREDIIVANS